MRYDQGFGRDDGWETRMPDGRHGWRHGYPDPRRGGGPGNRPWVGGYRAGYQGGSNGYPLRTVGPLHGRYDAFVHGPADHERGFRRPRGRGPFAQREYGRDFRGRARERPLFAEDGNGRFRAPLGRVFGGRGYGRDFFRGMRGGYDRDVRGGGGYDLPFRNAGLPEEYHPRYSPIGGTYAPMGGSYAVYRQGHVPPPLAETWTSDWTRWF